MAGVLVNYVFWKCAGYLSTHPPSHSPTCPPASRAGHVLDAEREKVLDAIYFDNFR